MDAERFDAIAKSLGTGVSRRRGLAALATGLVGGALARRSAGYAAPIRFKVVRLPQNAERGTCRDLVRHAGTNGIAYIDPESGQVEHNRTAVGGTIADVRYASPVLDNPNYRFPAPQRGLRGFCVVVADPRPTFTVTSAVFLYDWTRVGPESSDPGCAALEQESEQGALQHEKLHVGDQHRIVANWRWIPRPQGYRGCGPTVPQAEEDTKRVVIAALEQEKKRIKQEMKARGEEVDAAEPPFELDCDQCPCAPERTCSADRCCARDDFPFCCRRGCCPPAAATCCRDGDCCPASHAVCCPDNEHCCPTSHPACSGDGLRCFAATAAGAGADGGHAGGGTASAPRLKAV